MICSCPTPFDALVLRTKVVGHDYAASLDPGESILSSNEKTGRSINVPVAFTCRPTPMCRIYCYAARRGRPALWKKVLRKQLRLLRYLKATDPIVVAERIHREYVRYRLTFLVWNGIGDLIPETVAAINAICRLYPHVVQKVSTRKPDLAASLDREAANLYIAFSLDASADSARRWAAMKASSHPRVFPVFLRTSLDEDTMGARVVMNAKQHRLELPYEDPVTVCPADGGQIKEKGACARCRLCFSATVLDGHQHRFNPTKSQRQGETK